MAGFFFNPQPGNTLTPVALAEFQWRTQIAHWIDNVDFLEAQLNGAIGVQWFRAPDGDYWVDANSAFPPAFVPTASNAANPNLNNTDNTNYESIPP